MPDIVPLPLDYTAWLAELKTRIHNAQQRASLSVNRELVLRYWQIGRDILARQDREGWGAKVIERLSQDLRNAFPDMKGFSPRNLKYMRSFAEAWPDESIVQEALAQFRSAPSFRHPMRRRNSEKRRFEIGNVIEQAPANDGGDDEQ